MYLYEWSRATAKRYNSGNEDTLKLSGEGPKPQHTNLHIFCFVFFALYIQEIEIFSPENELHTSKL